MLNFILGFECTKRLRKIEATLRRDEEASTSSGDKKDDHHQLVVVCSANADEETTNLAYDAGVDGFLEKPLQLDDFMKIYQNLKNIGGSRS